MRRFLGILLMFRAAFGASYAGSDAALGSTSTEASALASALVDSIILYLPVASETAGANLAKELIENRLAAAASLIPRGVELGDSGGESEEIILLVQTTENSVDAVRSFVKDVPARDAAARDAAARDGAAGSTGAPAARDIGDLAGGGSFIPTLEGVRSFKADARATEEPVEDAAEPPQALAEAATDAGGDGGSPEGAASIAMDSQSEGHATAYKDQPFFVFVQGRPSTGYLWQVDRVASSASLNVGNFEPRRGVVRNRKRIGRAVNFQLRVIPTQVGEQTLILRYVRPWDVDDDPQTKTVFLHVQLPEEPDVLPET